MGLCWGLAACGGADAAPRGGADHTPGSLAVASLFPDTIHAGDRIIVTGSGFSKSINRDTVRVDGAAAIVSAATDSDIIAIALYCKRRVASDCRRTSHIAR